MNLYLNCIYFFSGKPDPPEKIDVLEITKNSAVVGWVPPMRDGGAKIDGYVIEYLELIPPKELPQPVEIEGEVEGEGGEQPAPPAPAPPVEEEEEEEEKEDVWTPYTVVKGLSISISGLKEGNSYRFRVAARNAMGCSLPTETRDPIEVKEQIRKL